MKFKSFSHYFHDGIVYDINVEWNDIVFLILSYVIDDEEFDHSQQLNNFNRIFGKLRLFNVKSITINSKPVKTNELCYKHGTILDLDINDNIVEINLDWLFKGKSNIYQNIKFDIQKYHFENLSNLPTPKTSFDEQGNYIVPKISQ